MEQFFVEKKIQVKVDKKQINPNFKLSEKGRRNNDLNQWFPTFLHKLTPPDKKLTCVTPKVFLKPYGTRSLK